MLPNVSITKSDGNTGVTSSAPDGILAIIGPSSAGTKNVAGGYSKKAVIRTEFGYGKLPEVSAWIADLVGKPQVLVRCEDTTAGAYGTATETNVGTSVITAAGTEPLDDFDFKIEFTTGGTRGTPGIIYRYTVNGVTSGLIALGTDTSIAIPNTGVGVSLAAGTILTGQTYAAKTTAPKMTNADLVLALEALRISTLTFEAILLVGPVDATMVATAAAWKTARALEGRYYSIVCNTVHRDPGTQTFAQYKTAMDTAFGASADIDTVVCYDAFDTVSVFDGRTYRRDTAMAVAARGMGISIGRDCAEVAIGPLAGVSILDTKGAPKYHDENAYPGADDSRFTTLRTIDGFIGTYITNPKLLSPPGSDYVFWQHSRCMNRAASITKQLLTKELSKGVRKVKKKVGATEISVIEEGEAARIEQLISAELRKALNGQVTGVGLTLSRTDDLSSNAGATINGELWLVSLAYLKNFAIEAKFLRTVPASAV
jgi:hypothetical protein